MNKIIIIKLPYDQVSFKFISSHYDYHLTGTCYYNDEICYFTTDYPEYNDALEEFEMAYTTIYKLSFLNKLKWIIKQWLFEIFVGKHCSITKYGKYKKYTANYMCKKPIWFYYLLMKLYYKIIKKVI